MLPGTVETGPVLSWTTAVADPEPVTPPLSVAEQVIGVEPIAKVEAGCRAALRLRVRVVLGVVDRDRVRDRSPAPGPVASAGCWLVMVTVTVGAPLGLTVTVNEAVPLLPESSVAVQVTVVVPTGKFEPEFGLQVGVTDVSTVSVAVAAPYETFSPGDPTSGTDTFGGGVTLGSVVS